MNEKEAVLNILIAEDDDAAAHLIKTNLKRSGLDTVFFRTRNGEETLKLLQGNSIPQNDKLVVLLDIRMPRMDGIQVLKVMKTSETLRKIPVVMLTTSDRPKEVEACYQLGCNFYLKKQVDYSKFVEAIKKFSAFIKSCELPSFGDMADE